MILVNDSHLSKALSPIVVTEFGIVILVNDLQPKKALLFIFRIPLGITTFVFFEKHVCNIFSFLSYKILSITAKVLLLSDIFIFVNDLQYEKAPSPIVVTEFGIMILVNESQLEKALSPIVVTEFGIVILVNK